MRTLLLVALVGGCMGGAPRGDHPAPMPPDPSTPTVTVPGAPTPPDAPAEPASVAPEPAPPDPAPALVTPDPPTPATPAPPTPAPRDLVTSAPASLWACTTDADCVIECDLPGECCGAPCGCRTAVNRHVLTELKTHPWGQCTKQERQDCPAVGCAYEPSYGARCEDGRCRANDPDDPFGMRRDDP